MSDRGSAWSITINNPIKADEENIALARQRGWKVDGQLEKGENGTPHYQLMVKTPQVRFTAVKKQFPRAHIEKARNEQALKQYVHKEETREAELSTTQSQYPSQQQVWRWFYEEWEEDCKRRSDEAIDDYRHLQVFDAMVNRKIREGMYLELIAVNPQIRSSIKKFGRSIYFREKLLHNRQTDRQTEENIVLD